MINDRQAILLRHIVEDYIRSAAPLGSEYIAEKYPALGVSSATVRNEMGELTDERYLEQPHTSAGRIPTEKAYRFFVDEILQDAYRASVRRVRERMRALEEALEEQERLEKSLASFFAEASKTLSVCYSPARGVRKKGLREFLNEPEFQDRKHLYEAVLFSEGLDEEFFEHLPRQHSQGTTVRVFIGNENPAHIRGRSNYSVVVSTLTDPQGEQEYIAFVGPLRMRYRKLINLAQAINKEF